MLRAGREKGTFVWEVPVDGQTLHPRLLGYGADGRARHPHGFVQLDGRLDYTPSGLLLALGAPLHIVLARHAASSRSLVNKFVLPALTDATDHWYCTASLVNSYV